MEIPNNYQTKFQVQKRKVYEFQDVCAELQKTYGKGIWGAVRVPGCSPEKMRRADKICKARDIHTLGYFIGVIKKLK